MNHQIVEGDLSPELLNNMQSSEVIAVDCETSGLDWKTDELALVQLYAPKLGTVFVRPLPERPNRMLSLFEAKQIRKVFHYAMFDLKFLIGRWEFTPQKVACTKITAKLLDPDGQQSLKPLLKNHLGVEISKDLQTSNWFAAKLTKEQLQYASNDVIHLPPLEAELWRCLKKRGLDDLAVHCFDHLPTRVQLDLMGYPDIYVY